MTTFKGKLTFISLWNPINLKTKDTELDLRVQYFGLFRYLNGRKTSMKYSMNDMTICFDKDSEYELKFEKSDDEIESIENDTLGIILKKSNDDWGISNITAYLSNILKRLNSMQVIVDVEKDSIAIRHDESEKVHEIKYTHNNSCSISDDKVKKICKVGQKDCCIFLTVSSDGFMCNKFNYIGSTLLNRYSKGTMRANRIGNCKIVGRSESPIISKK